jgi:hypothetical protein
VAKTSTIFRRTEFGERHLDTHVRRNVNGIWPDVSTLGRRATLRNKPAEHTFAAVPANQGRLAN